MPLILLPNYVTHEQKYAVYAVNASFSAVAITADMDANVCVRRRPWVYSS
jgi:hypothetical protein